MWCAGISTPRLGQFFRSRLKSIFDWRKNEFEFEVFSEVAAFTVLSNSGVSDFLNREKFKLIQVQVINLFFNYFF